MLFNGHRSSVSQDEKCWSLVTQQRAMHIILTTDGPTLMSPSQDSPWAEFVLQGVWGSIKIETFGAVTAGEGGAFGL